MYRTTTGVYSINAANVTFLNQGDMTGTGRQFGIIISQPTTTTGINVTNQGTISWNRTTISDIFYTFKV